MVAAISWARWEDRASTLLPSPEVLSAPRIALPLARIETHYFINDCFFPDRDVFLLNKKNLATIAHIRGVIVQGRYDMVCPIEAAWALHKAWPSSELYISPDAGHSAKECTTTHHLIEATDDFPKLFP
jgi:proline iminopeptidase